MTSTDRRTLIAIREGRLLSPGEISAAAGLVVRGLVRINQDETLSLTPAGLAEWGFSVPPLFALEAERRGDHIHVVVRAGVPGQRALCGKLTMSPAEWDVLRVHLDGKAEIGGDL